MADLIGQRLDRQIDALAFEARALFRETMEECRAAAIEERAHLKGEPHCGDIGSFPIYECAVRMGVPPSSKS